MRLPEEGKASNGTQNKNLSEHPKTRDLHATSTFRSMPELLSALHILHSWLARDQSNTSHLIAPSPRHHASCRWRRPNCPSTAAQGHKPDRAHLAPVKNLSARLLPPRVRSKVWSEPTTIKIRVVLNTKGTPEGRVTRRTPSGVLPN